MSRLTMGDNDDMACRCVIGYINDKKRLKVRSIMYCNNCGEEIIKGAKFCVHCGTEVSGKMRNRRNVVMVGVAGFIGLCFIISLVILLTNRKPTICLNDYVSVEVSGFDSMGKARFTFDEETLMEDYGDIIAKNYKNVMADAIDLSDDAEYISVQSMIMNCINGSFDKGSELYNGDEITFTWNCDDDAAMENYGVKLKYSDIEIEIDQLKEIEEVDPFEGIDVVFSGYAPNGYADVVKNTEKSIIHKLSYRLSESNDLRNGDVITLRVVNDSLDPEYFAKEYGVILTETEKEYVVDGLSRYASSSEDVNEEMLKQLLDEAQRIVSEEIPGSNIQYIENYWLALSEEYDGYKRNRLILVYQADNQEDYYLVTFANIVLDNEKTKWENVSLERRGSIQDYVSRQYLLEGFDIYETNIGKCMNLPVEQDESLSGAVDVERLDEQRQNMYYIMDALADQCYSEAYNPSDAHFFWGALSTFISFNPERWADETTVIGWRVERSRVEQYAAGLFEKYNGLMDIPENSYMVQTQDGNNYEIMAGDRGMEYTKITSWIVENDGTEKVTMDLIDEMEDESFATYVFTLVENPQLKTNNNQIFMYSVKSVEKID